MMPMALPSVWIALPLSLILPLTVYNFEVNDLHNYYVGTQEVLVHNECIKMKILRDQLATLGIPEPNITQFVESLQKTSKKANLSEVNRALLHQHINSLSDVELKEFVAIVNSAIAKSRHRRLPIKTKTLSIPMVL
jgi:hypothetical protein